MKATKVKVPSFFTEKEQELYKKLTKEQKGHLIHMREDTAKDYLYRCVKEQTKMEPKDIKEEIMELMNNSIDEKVLSQKADNHTMRDKNFKCKFCGQRFDSPEKADKHQKLCF